MVCVIIVAIFVISPQSEGLKTWWWLYKPFVGVAAAGEVCVCVCDSVSACVPV